MIIYSEITGDIYPSVDDCIDAELAFRAEEKRLEAEKEAREKELQEAYDEAIAACDRYLKLADIAIDEDNVAEDGIKAEDVVKEVEIEFTDEDMETLDSAIKRNIPDGVQTTWSDTVRSNWEGYYSADIPQAMEDMKLSATNLRLAVEQALAYDQEQN